MKKKLLKFLILFTLAAVVALLAYLALSLFLPELIEIAKTGDREAVVAYIKDSGTLRGGFLVFLLQVAQVFSVIIPALPIHVAAGALFGTVKGGLICIFGMTLASTAVFLSARKLGGGLDKLLNVRSPKSSFLTKGRPAAVLVALCLLPIVPTGAIPYLTARTKLSLRAFVPIFSLSFAPEIFLSCAAGRNILSGNLTVLIILGAIKLTVALCYFMRRKLLKLFKSLKRGILLRS